MYIGLSLSFCIADIIKGKKLEKNVEKIITSTKFSTPEELDELIEQYKKTYWSSGPIWAEAVVRRMVEEGKIEQPRLEGKEHPQIGKGHWKLRRWEILFTDGSKYYAEAIGENEACDSVEGVLDDKDEDVEIDEACEILEGTPEWENFKPSFSWND